MKVHGYLSGNKVHDRAVRAFMAGVPEEHNCLLIDNWGYHEPDIAVVFGVYKKRVPISWPRGGIIEKHHRAGKKCVVLETGYINRGDGPEHHYAAGFDGLNNRADFRNRGMPRDRAEKIGVKLKPYRSGEYILLVGQIPWDASVQHVDFQGWLNHAASRIRDHTDRKIIFRNHPLLKNTLNVNADIISDVSLEEDFARSHCVVTLNSNTGVDAVLQGLQVFAFDEGSMVWPVAHKSLEKLETPDFFSRADWLNDLCYAQWAPAEMSRGETWRHLFRS